MDSHDTYLSYFNDFIKTPEQAIFSSVWLIINVQKNGTVFGLVNSLL